MVQWPSDYDSGRRRRAAGTNGIRMEIDFARFCGSTVIPSGMMSDWLDRDAICRWDSWAGSVSIGNSK